MVATMDPNKWPDWNHHRIGANETVMKVGGVLPQVGSNVGVGCQNFHGQGGNVSDGYRRFHTSVLEDKQLISQAPLPITNHRIIHQIFDLNSGEVVCARPDHEPDLGSLVSDIGRAVFLVTWELV